MLCIAIEEGGWYAGLGGCITCVQGSFVGKYGMAFSVSLPFISLHFWMNTGQLLLQLM